MTDDCVVGFESAHSSHKTCEKKEDMAKENKRREERLTDQLDMNGNYVISWTARFKMIFTHIYVTTWGCICFQNIIWEEDLLRMILDVVKYC